MQNLIKENFEEIRNYAIKLLKYLDITSIRNEFNIQLIA